MQVKALPGKVLVTELERGSRVVRGIIIPDDNGKDDRYRSDESQDEICARIHREYIQRNARQEIYAE